MGNKAVTYVNGKMKKAGDDDTVDFDGNVNLGNADSDNIVFSGEVDSNIIPDDDNTFNLGSAAKQWASVHTADITSSGVATYNTVEFSNSNTMKFNQVYYGDNNGSYFSANEYQKVVTIIPSGASQNYQVIGRITAQNAGETHTVYFNAALRSNTLPDLDWTIYYDEEYNGSRYIDPQLWTKETTTAGFIFAFKTLATIYGNVTVDIDVVPRNSTQKANVSINNNPSSEQSSVEAGYTANDMTKVVSKKGQEVTFENALTVGEINTNGDLTLDADGGQIYMKDNGVTYLTFNVNGTQDEISAIGHLKLVASADITLNAQQGDIYFQDNGTQRMRIEDATGDVAIGSHSPSYRLDVQDVTTGFVANFENTSTSSSADVLRLKISKTGNLTTSNSFIDLLDGDNDANGRIRGNGSGGITYSSAFTGQHPTSIVMNDNITTGMIVESNGQIWSRYTDNMETGIPKVTVSTQANSKKVFGVISNLTGSFDGMVKASNQSENETHIEVNSIGEGLVWVTNINGNIENGDYITSSPIYGLGQKQNDDILRNYTVAKCTEDIDWDSVDGAIIHEGIEYKKYLTICTYHCG